MFCSTLMVLLSLYKHLEKTMATMLTEKDFIRLMYRHNENYAFIALHIVNFKMSGALSLSLSLCFCLEHYAKFCIGYSATKS